MLKNDKMKKLGIFYGSNTGTTAGVAHRLGRVLGVSDDDIHDVADTVPSVIADYDTLIFGTSTWGSGNLEEDWENFISAIEVLDLKGKKIALFGCGDETMSDTFCNGVGTLYERLVPTGAEFIGEYPADCYHFDKSSAVVDGTPVGLLLDEVNHPELTDLRLRAWADILTR